MSLRQRLSPATLTKLRTFRLTNGCVVTVPLSDVIGRGLFVHGTFEHETIEAWERVVPDGGTVVDVGANYGVFTLAAARRVGPTGRVLAFEPDPGNRVRLEHNVAQNYFTDRVSVLPFALLDRDARLPLGTPDEANAGMARLGVGTTIVTCRRLDDVLEDLGIKVTHAIKIDVEGHEAGVLRGAERALAGAPKVVMEVNGDEAVSILRDLGFVLRTTHNEDFVNAAAHQRPNETVNVLAVPPAD